MPWQAIRVKKIRATRIWEANRVPPILLSDISDGFMSFHTHPIHQVILLHGNMNLLFSNVYVPTHPVQNFRALSYLSS